MQLCVVVRTYAAEQRASLAALLASLIAAGEKGASGCGLRISVDVLPTDANQSEADAYSIGSCTCTSDECPIV